MEWFGRAPAPRGPHGPCAGLLWPTGRCWSWSTADGCYRRRGHVITAIDKSRVAGAGMMARPVIQVRSISAALALSKAKLAHGTFATATESVGAPPVPFPRRTLPF
jgi:hypothetical protein